MRKSMPKLMLTLAALLVASVMIPDTQLQAARNTSASRSLNRASSSGQRARNMTRQNARPDGGDGPLANINEDWYLEFTPGYMRAGGSSLDSFYGASVALGYRLSLVDRIQLEIGVYASNNYTGAISYNRSDLVFDGRRPDINTGVMGDVTSQPYAMTLNGAKSAKAKAVPVLLSYTYSFRLDSAERWQFRLTPVAGILAMFDTWNVNAAGSYAPADGTIFSNAPGSDISGNGATLDRGEHFSGSDTKAAFVMGGGFGLTWEFGDRWYADAGYRYLWVSKASNRPSNGLPWNGVSAWNGMNTHLYTLTLGWKF